MNHLMRLTLGLVLAVICCLPAQAEIKRYDLDVLIVLNTTTLTVTGFTRDLRVGNIEINNESNAAPTLDTFEMLEEQLTTTRTDTFAGPNSFIHIRRLNTMAVLPGQTGTGDTEGFVQWNPLSSWTPTGGVFCKGSNEINAPAGLQICSAVRFPHEMTMAATVPSPSYDFPLWTFDAQGDFSSDSYLWRIDSNASANLEYFLRGHLRTNVPALSALGFIVLGGGLLFVGMSALRRRDPH